MKIAVVGAGRVGLVTAAGFADFGHHVTCVELDPERRQQLDAGGMPVHEPALEALVRRNVAGGRLDFAAALAPAVRTAQIVFLAVEGAETLTVAPQIGHAIDGFTVVATRTATPVGTCDALRAAIASATTRAFAVAANPALGDAGAAVASFFKPACVVVGTDDTRARALFQQLYRGVMLTNDRLLAMDVRSAELCASAAAALRDVEQGAMDELARLCDATGADLETIRGALEIPPGRPATVDALRTVLDAARAHGVAMPVACAALQATERHHRWIEARIVTHFSSKLTGARIAIWGLGAAEDEPAWLVALVERLHQGGAVLVGCIAGASTELAAPLRAKVALVEDAHTASAGCDAVLLASDVPAARVVDLARLRATMRSHVLFDPHNVWDAASARQAGFTYYGTGSSP